VVDSHGRIGDWEIDTMHGRGNACVVTVVERKTGLVRIGQIQRATKELTLERTVELLRSDRQRVKNHHRRQRHRVSQRIRLTQHV
jgi:IS30 family transposase